MDKQSENEKLQRHRSHFRHSPTTRTPKFLAPTISTCGVCDSVCPVPVLMVSCGHRFCLGCLEDFWQRLPNCERSCPKCSLCKEDSSLSSRQTLQCDLCPSHSPCVARWSCLTCEESYCPEHFQPHILGEDEGTGSHIVCDAAGEEAKRMHGLRRGIRRCPEHMERAVELFCGECRVCICTLCPVLGAHKGHPVKLIQEEAMHRKNLTSRCLEQLDQKRSCVLGNIQHIEQAAADLKARTLASTESLSRLFTELRLLLDEEESIAKKYLDEKAKMTLWSYDEKIEISQDQISAIDKFSALFQGIHQQSDDVQLIQDYTSTSKEMQSQVAATEQWHSVPVMFDHVEKYYSSFIDALKSSFKGTLVSRLQKVTGPSGRSIQEPGELIKTKSFVDRKLFLKYARSPSLDPDTMHPKLRISEDRLRVHCAWLGKFYSSHPYRFDKVMQILSRDGYLSGTHYWEVDVLQAERGWWIGITYPSIQRKGDSEFSRLGWTSGSWCIKKYDDEYWAFHKAERKAIHLENAPEKVGVFLDYESGVVSFFDVTSGMKLLHTFRCIFTEPVYPAMRLWDGSITMCRLT